jgi:hypothetical protein
MPINANSEWRPIQNPKNKLESRYKDTYVGHAILRTMPQIMDLTGY